MSADLDAAVARLRIEAPVLREDGAPETADAIDRLLADWERLRSTETGAPESTANRRVAAAIAERDAARAEVERLVVALRKIDAIRNSIVGTQSLNWSAHAYPLVAALEEAGFKGLDYEKARAEARTTLDELARLRERDAKVRMELGMAVGRCPCAHESLHESTLHHAEKALAMLKETP